MGLKTERKSATVSILNKSSKNILAVGISHKYSDVYKNSDTFTDIKTEQKSSTSMNVDYNIGTFTSGKDWWLVTWVTDDGKGHITSPNNFRDIIDKLEGISGQVIGPLVTLTAAGAAIATGGAATPAAIAAATLFATVVINVMTNNESTAGFKQHILREEDSGENIIEIHDEKVVFKSRSGDSETVLTLITVKKNKNGEYELVKG
ncbi:MAG TPA: hypothetical protein DIT18_16490 [Pseudomonas sp.]|nr:hypothetical protein [Pseudomonas sp.]